MENLDNLEKFDESRLEIGDILIFEDFDFEYGKLYSHMKKDGIMGGAYYLLHYLIAWFDPGKEGDQYRNIYHAGIWGKVDVNRDKPSPELMEECIVQAGTNGIGHASLMKTMSHDAVKNVYVCRVKDKSATFETEINDSIKDFYKEKGSYSFETAWLLAVICSMRYSSGSLYEMLRARVGSITAHLLVQAVLEMINQYNDDHQRVMVACSTLVAMMYKNAGHELPVHVFESSKATELVKPKIEFGDVEKDFDIDINQSTDSEWPELKETLVTPRQLMESSAVEVVGVMHHTPKPEN